MTIQDHYHDAEAKLLGCQHEHPDMTNTWCCACWNTYVYRRRAIRKAELAQRPADCQRCGRRPHTYLLAGLSLCGRCKTLTLTEHHQALAKAGHLAIFAQGLLVDTSQWKGKHHSIPLEEVAV